MDAVEPSWKNKHFEILRKIDDLCRENGIDLFLCEDTALAAYRDGSLSDNVYTAIDVRNVHKFIDAVEGHEGLCVRSMRNYYHYGSLDLKVYDPETTDFDLDMYRDLGFAALYVTVRLIKHVPDNKRRRNAARGTVATYQELIKKKYDDRKIKFHARLLLQRFMSAFVSEEAFRQKVFESSVSAFSDESKRVSVGGYMHKPEVFSSMTTVNIGDRPFNIPEKAEAYFKVHYGDNWEEKALPEYKENNLRFRDETIPSYEFIKSVEYLDLDDYFANRKTLLSLNRRVRKADRFFRRDKNIVLRTHRRFAFWQKYMPRKEEIIKLYSEGDIEGIRDIMGDYLNELEIFAKKKLTIFFDREIFDIAKAVFMAEGKEELTESMEELIPPEHLEPIRIKNYKGEYI